MTTASAEEESIRAFLRERPRNAKAMSRLSCLLVERAKLYSKSNSKRDRLQKEAEKWARKAIELAPNRSRGYAALSLASPSHSERMEALIRAVELDAGKEKERTMEETAAYVGSLARLLVEPREEDARNTTVARTSAEHPSRRDLSGTEAALYQRILDTLEMVWADSPESPNVQCYVGQVELRLGLFFRKMLPSEVHRPRSRKHLIKACEHLPENDVFSKKAKFWLATFSTDDDIMGEGEASKYVVGIDRCPEEYVVTLYSTFAAKFDKLLVEKLHYETPTKLRQLVDAVVDSEEPNMVWVERGMDLGCGTGLSGEAFRSCTRHLTGVDLSPEMIDKARQRNCYNKILVGDVTSILCEAESDRPPPKYDLIFSCDVFVYLGDLSMVFSSVRSALSDRGSALFGKDGLFAFSTEYLEEHVADDFPYILQASARFAHKRSYLERLSAEFGFEILMLQILPIRKNKGKDILGILVVLRNS